MGKFTKDRRVVKNYLYSRKDIYYRKAKEDQFRARSAYKLIQIDQIFRIFLNVERAIDLCAAPGSWSQVLQKTLTQKGLFKDKGLTRIIAVDLQEMAPLDNVVQIQGDITKKSTVDNILLRFQGQKANIIVSDGAPDVTGFHDIDQYIQSQLIVATLNICLMALLEGGVFVAKVFKGSDVKQLYSQFKVFFRQVWFIKPKSSRQSSVENFLVCLDFDPPFKVNRLSLYTFQNELDQQRQEEQAEENLEDSKINCQEKNKYFSFLTCGDLSGFDQLDQ